MKECPLHLALSFSCMEKEEEKMGKNVWKGIWMCNKQCICTLSIYEEGRESKTFMNKGGNVFRMDSMRISGCPPWVIMEGNLKGSEEQWMTMRKKKKIAWKRKRFGDKGY